MTPEQMEKFKNLIEDSTKKYVDSGGKLVRGAYHVGTYYCPIKATVGDFDQTKYSKNEYANKLKELCEFDISTNDVASVYFGFDGHQYNSSFNENLYNFGQYLREKFKPLSVEEVESLLKNN